MLSAEIAKWVLTISFQQMSFWKNFLFFSQETGFDVMQIVSKRDSLNEMSNSVGWKKKEKKKKKKEKKKKEKYHQIYCLLKLPREW